MRYFCPWTFFSQNWDIEEGPKCLIKVEVNTTINNHDLDSGC